MQDALRAVVPELNPLVARLYSGDTPLVWECLGMGTKVFKARTGIDAGCPFSCILFCLGLHQVLQRAQAAEPAQTQKAFMDDVYSMCKVEAAESVLDKASGAGRP